MFMLVIKKVVDKSENSGFHTHTFFKEFFGFFVDTLRLMKCGAGMGADSAQSRTNYYFVMTHLNFEFEFDLNKNQKKL
jgi:hypothetical protein